MNMILIAIILTFVALLISTITDLKKREVPDYISYGLIFIAFAIAVIYSIINWEYIYLAQSVMGLIVGIIIAYTMFYLGQWGGGDSKLIMGIGAIMGFNIFNLFNINIFGENNFWLLIMLANIIFFGAAYGLAWSIVLAIKNRKVFIKSLDSWIHKREILMARRIIMAAVIIILIILFTIVPQEYRILLLSFTAILYITFYVWIFVKIIEETCMIKDIPVGRLTEGDWIYKEVRVGKKYITGPKDLGVSREQITELKRYCAKGKIKTVTIKEGIPFIPAFLLAFVATVIIYYISAGVL